MTKIVDFAHLTKNYMYFLTHFKFSLVIKGNLVFFCQFVFQKDMQNACDPLRTAVVHSSRASEFVRCVQVVPPRACMFPARGGGFGHFWESARSADFFDPRIDPQKVGPPGPQGGYPLVGWVDPPSPWS